MDEEKEDFGGSFEGIITPRRTFDLSFDTGNSNGTKIPPFCINMGKNTVMELKEFRKASYIGLIRMSYEGDIKNRFNLPLDLLKNFRKAIEAMKAHVAKHAPNKI